MSRAQAGFTLVEVLIALTIVSVAMAAFIRMTSQTIGTMDAIEQRSLAMLSAQNSLAEQRLSGRASAGIDILECPQATQPFVCRIQTLPAEQGTRAVTVDVYASRSAEQRIFSMQTRLPEGRQ